MRTYATFMILVSLAFLLAACGADATPTEAAALSNIYTAAAATLGLQAGPVAEIATPLIGSTATRSTFLTTLPVTVTQQRTTSFSSQSTANGCNNATYVSDVTIPDGTVFAPGAAFIKTWQVQNIGTCDWDEDYLLTFVSGTEKDGETTEIDQDILSGTTGDVSVSLSAPASKGTYTGYWRLADSDGNAFGQSVYVMIVVSDDTATTTPTPTSTTDTVEWTSTSTSTAQATETFIPTSAPLEIPAGTDTPTPQ